jgi:hypothetical protein
MSLLGIAICNGLQVWAMQWCPAHQRTAERLLGLVDRDFRAVRRTLHRPGTRAVVGLAIGFIGTALLIWPAGQLAVITGVIQ